MSYSKSEFTVDIDRNSNLNSSVQSCTMDKINLGNKVITTLSVEIQATDDSIEWLSNLNYQKPCFIHYSVNNKFGEAGNFFIKKVEMISSKTEGGDLTYLVIFEG